MLLGTSDCVQPEAVRAVAKMWAAGPGMKDGGKGVSEWADELGRGKNDLL